MVDIFAGSRKLIIHKAHSVVGVQADAPVVCPFFRIADTPDHERLGAAKRLVLATWQQDAGAQRAVAAFEHLIAERDDVDAERLELDAVADGFSQMDNSDGVVLFDRGLQIARHEADLEPPARIGCFASDDADLDLRVDVASDFANHPLTKGVRPFRLSKTPPAWGIRMPTDASVLLTAAAEDQTWPLAWVRHRRHGRAFCTSLGSSEDFRCPEFVRLVSNAIDWVFE